MNQTSRRKMLQLMAVTAVAPALASRQAHATTVGTLIDPPAGAMTFRRSVIRQLAGGARISVVRDFSIRFVRFADGFHVEGHQTGVDVRAPENLAAFARLERERVETATFPITLDPFGQIVSEDPSTARADQIGQAFNEAMERLGRQRLEQAERSELGQFVAALHQAGGMLTVTMPTDLFSPVETERAENRTLPLPGGDFGTVTSRFDAETDWQTGLMRRALREVLTEVAGDRRQTFEHWQLG